ncbi:MAG TPA: hypothetical protein VMU10_10365, partial [Desulfomonilia bacterium]|nr:hypothetical protein [Desulfomonilia bacterium]
TWVNSCVTPYGLVKLESRDTEMLLLGFGTDAKSLITEKPEEIKKLNDQQGDLPELTPFNKKKPHIAY